MYGFDSVETRLREEGDLSEWLEERLAVVNPSFEEVTEWLRLTWEGEMRDRERDDVDGWLLGTIPPFEDVIEISGVTEELAYQRDRVVDTDSVVLGTTGEFRDVPAETLKLLLDEDLSSGSVTTHISVPIQYLQ